MTSPALTVGAGTGWCGARIMQYQHSNSQQRPCCTSCRKAPAVQQYHTLGHLQNSTWLAAVQSSKDTQSQVPNGCVPDRCLIHDLLQRKASTNNLGRQAAPPVSGHQQFSSSGHLQHSTIWHDRGTPLALVHHGQSNLIGTGGSTGSRPTRQCLRLPCPYLPRARLPAAGT